MVDELASTEKTHIGVWLPFGMQKRPTAVLGTFARHSAVEDGERTAARLLSIFTMVEYNHYRH